ncbi:protein phosphatase 2C-like domain-containing protein 1 [Pteronotus mesoamericanus]|uniref:protein phosphatase 2C-like domain-containing protein 1 n=1 Tax=Pteronotus mesoamericanus TaxID=1884717 RepID=UPI0023ECA653|nr:protein phosphatase 2C-like domain-containing protein 1 [Pteronotus parnellii mesoamericanus]
MVAAAAAAPLGGRGLAAPGPPPLHTPSPGFPPRGSALRPGRGHVPRTADGGCCQPRRCKSTEASLGLLPAARGVGAPHPRASTPSDPPPGGEAKLGCVPSSQRSPATATTATTAASPLLPLPPRLRLKGETCGKVTKRGPGRVFWKSRLWDERKSTFDSEEQAPPLQTKHSRKKEEAPSRGSEDHHEICDQVITFPCSICKCNINLPRVFLHKKQHTALATLGLKWKGGNKPAPSIISVQRQLIVTKLLSSFTFTETVLQNINNAFELLRKKQIPAYRKIIGNIHSNPMYHPQKICHLLIKGMAICDDRNSTWKADMNDKFTVVNNFGNKPNVCFFGLFDGHHGASAADFASMELPVLLLHQLSRFDPSYQMTPEQQKLISSFHTVFREEYRATENLFSMKKRTKELRHEHESIHKAFAKAFWRMDRLLRLGRKEVSRVQWSGCSAVTCILEGKIKSPYAKRDPRGITDQYGWAESVPSQRMPQVISGELHVANTGNVQAVLCRNGKGFCLTKEHTMRNTDERRRVLQNGAIISSNEPYGLLEGQMKTSRGLGFHGNSKLKKFIIPAPQTISVSIDDLCQFLILATNGLWEVLDNKEVTALALTMFQVYKETPNIQKKSSPSKGPLFFPDNEPSITVSDSNIYTLFQCKSEECVSSTNAKEHMSDSKYSKYFTCDPKNAQTLLPEMTNRDPCSEETDRHTEGLPKDLSKEKISTESFYEGAAEYISHELVNAALMAGSRDNITVMVILLCGSELSVSEVKDKSSDYPEYKNIDNSSMNQILG